ncbi:MAG TPA: hypothetical protein VFX49_21440 [Chloroflexota bacterium]|nr:hypothetical protein [Chloroflexota bacterium]
MEGELARFMAHSGAVILAVAFLVFSIGVTLLMTTKGRTESE